MAATRTSVLNADSVVFMACGVLSNVEVTLDGVALSVRPGNVPSVALRFFRGPAELGSSQVLGLADAFPENLARAKFFQEVPTRGNLVSKSGCFGVSQFRRIGARLCARHQNLARAKFSIGWQASFLLQKIFANMVRYRHNLLTHGVYAKKMPA